MRRQPRPDEVPAGMLAWSVPHVGAREFRQLLSALRVVRARLMATRSVHIKHPKPRAAALIEYHVLRSSLTGLLAGVDPNTAETQDLVLEAVTLLQEEAPWQTDTPASAS